MPFSTPPMALKSLSELFPLKELPPSLNTVRLVMQLRVSNKAFKHVLFRKHHSRSSTASPFMIFSTAHMAVASLSPQEVETLLRLRLLRFSSMRPVMNPSASPQDPMLLDVITRPCRSSPVSPVMPLSAAHTALT
jgi:hypothetical protein